MAFRIFAVMVVALGISGAPQVQAQDLSAAKAADDARDYETAWPLYLAAAEAGSADAMMQVANYLTYGKGVTKDGAQAIAWLEQMIIAAGDARGAWKIGEMYEYGDGVRADPQKAREWSCHGAELGNEDAAQRCAQHAEKGLGGPQDFALASKWYLFAAERGLGKSQGGVSRLKREGHFVDPAPPQAQLAEQPPQPASQANSSPTSGPAPAAAAPEAVAAAPAAPVVQQLTLAEVGAGYAGADDFAAGEALWEAGERRQAYGLFLASAKAGNPAAMYRVGDFHALKTSGADYDPMLAAAAFRAALDAGYGPAKERLDYAEETLRLRAEAFRANDKAALARLSERDTQEMLLTMALSDTFPDPAYGRYMAGRSLWIGRNGGLKDHTAALALLLDAGLSGYDEALLYAGRLMGDPDSPVYDAESKREAWYLCAMNDHLKCIEELSRDLYALRRADEAMSWAVRYKELTGKPFNMETRIQQMLDEQAAKRAEFDRKNQMGWRQQRRQALALNNQIGGGVTYGQSDFWNFGARNAAIYGGASSGGSATQNFNDSQGRINDWMENPGRYYGMAKPF